ncbi:hypothetical protein K439DRAFT_1647913 [Ramaria rubella]|nr:hypothetical protein K439DRAFT_1647913 [Ramaria rubella]
MSSRYCQTPTFGCNTIHWFTNNVSDMKKLAACDFKDILQCTMPAFEGLFPEPHESIIQCLLFTCASWHSLAKLHMHTDSTLARLDSMTTLLGQAIRKFAAVTSRRLAKMAQNNSTHSPATHAAVPQAPKCKAFNLSTPKLHFLSDYVSTIKIYGTTDSYSTQTVSSY